MPIKLNKENFLSWLKSRNQCFANNEFIVLGEYVNSYTPIDCQCMRCGCIWSVKQNSLTQGHGCPECAKKKRSAWKKISNDEFIQKVSELDNGIAVIGSYVSYKEKTQFVCSKGHVWEATPNNILNGCGCPYCARKAVLVGENDLWTTNPDVAKLLKNTDEGYMYSRGSGKKVEFTCPLCGFNCQKRIRDVCKQGFSCPKCSDGISYPNKFARTFLSQLPISEFICEYNPTWAKSYFYDNYFEYNDNRYILEMDGGFHYLENTVSHKSLEERQKIDAIKTALATDNGVIVIRVECIESNCDYIKNNILSSKLNNLFDLSNIDWNMCDKNAHKSLVKEVCNLYQKEDYSISKIMNILHISRKTVLKYLKIGSRFGWCNYS